MKKYKLNIFMMALSIIGMTSCDQDDSVDRVVKPTMSVTNSFTVKEGEDVSAKTFDFKLSDRVKTVSNTNIGNNAGAEVGIRIVGGTAVLGEDYTINAPTVFSTGAGFWGGDGYYVNIPGETLNYSLPFSSFITITNDSNNEETETIELLVSPAGLGQASIEQKITINIENRLVCPLESTKFVGNYLIEQTSTQLDGYSLSHGTVVAVTAVDEYTRVFNTLNYPKYAASCSTPNPFKLTFECATVNIPVQSMNCACSGTRADWFKPGLVPEAIDLSDDSVFTVTFTEDQADCSLPAEQTTYRFTKQ